jgi:uncharacterized protein YdeI (YjbR/CyaY-like superfamily)
MSKKPALTYNPEVDNFLDLSVDFAKPILAHLRELVHASNPEITETMKWSFPNFEYKSSILCSMASFKSHCSFGFWLASKMNDPDGVLKSGKTRPAMGDFGKIRQVSDLPSKETIIQFCRMGIELIENGEKLEKKPSRIEKNVALPLDLERAFEKFPGSLSFYLELPEGQKREYVVWISEAKTESTRAKRIETTAVWCSEGKRRLWKYESKG